MKRQVLVYGLLGGVLITVLKLTEYQFLVVEHSLEIYGGIVAVIFAGLGVWLGLKLTRTKEILVVPEPSTTSAIPFVPNDQRIQQLGITPRELEILGLIASGLSTREIAEKIYVSENTVKTHASRVLDKLNARRRTQAVQIGKQLGLIP